MYIRLAMDTILLNIVLSRFTFTPVKSLLYNDVNATAAAIGRCLCSIEYKYIDDVTRNLFSLSMKFQRCNDWLYCSLTKREGRWNRHASRYCFWDRYGGGAAQLLANFPLALVTVPEVFAKVYFDPVSYSVVKWRMGVYGFNGDL